MVGKSYTPEIKALALDALDIKVDARAQIT